MTSTNHPSDPSDPIVSAGGRDYSDVEANCRGCMGPCGRCHELASPPSSDPQRTLIKKWRAAANAHRVLDIDDDALMSRLNALRGFGAMLIDLCADELEALLALQEREKKCVVERKGP